MFIVVYIIQEINDMVRIEIQISVYLYRDMGFYCLFMYILSRLELVVARVKNEAIIKQ